MILTEKEQDQTVEKLSIEFYCSNCGETYLSHEVDRYCVCGVELHSYKNPSGDWVEIPCLFENRGRWKSNLDQSIVKRL
jgi:hypothetical protein